MDDPFTPRDVDISQLQIGDEFYIGGFSDSIYLVNEDKRCKRHVDCRILGLTLMKRGRSKDMRDYHTSRITLSPLRLARRNGARYVITDD